MAFHLFKLCQVVVKVTDVNWFIRAPAGICNDIRVAPEAKFEWLLISCEEMKHERIILQVGDKWFGHHLLSNYPS